jgi:U-box domain
MVFQSKRFTKSTIPKAYMCPITKDVMVDPVMNRSGRSYERTAILEWITSSQHGPYCPITKETLHIKDLIPNNKLRNEIRTWRDMQDGDDMTSTTNTNYTDDYDSTVRGEEVILAFNKMFQNNDVASSSQKQRKRILFGRFMKGHC